MSNVYAAPAADLSGAISSADTLPFALNGRIGRLRYLGYVIALYFLMGVGVALLEPLLAGGPVPSAVLSSVAGIGFLVAYMIVARRRMHDIGLGGWMILCMFIPFVNMYFGLVMLFKRGDDGNNEFGPEPSANSWGVKALVFGIPALTLIGIIAAAVPPRVK